MRLGLKLLLIGLTLIALALLMPWIAALGAAGAMVWDRLSGAPLALQRRIETLSSNRQCRFVAERDGALTVRDERTNRVVRQARLSPRDYRDLSATWQGTERIELVAKLRYPVMAFQTTLTWDLRTGRLAL